MAERLSETQHLSGCLPERLSILVIGDLGLDEYVTGDVSRVAFDRPIPVLRASDTLRTPGGAANLAQNLVSLGPEIQVHLLGVVGDDSAGASLTGLLAEQGILTQDVQTIANRPTTHKLRAVAQMDHYLVRIDRESTEAIPKSVEEVLLAAVRSQLPHVHGLICSDYNKGCLTPSLLQAIINEAHLSKKPVIIDPKGSDHARYVGASVIKPNLQELQTLTSTPVHSDQEIDAAAMKLLYHTNVEALVLTRGEAGVNIYGREGLIKSIPAHHVRGNVCDINGAGDTFMAAFALTYCNGASLLDSAKMGNAAAGLVVRRKGTATVSRGELLQQLSPGLLNIPSPFRETKKKFVDLDELLQQLESIRKAGPRVIFTNGCFDLLHAGHVELLEGAKSLDGILIVAVNTDESIAQLKGHKRPVIPQSQRVRVLAGLACVDFVILFEDPTPMRLISAIRPDVLVKGADYASHQVVGRDLVESWGGNVTRLPLIEGVSTTRILSNIIQRQKMP
jgi:D-beta-D-heptose 7-phosphate kinase / D-beta-D-heptose 1-phosphate adenosyltransferase